MVASSRLVLPGAGRRHQVDREHAVAREMLAVVRGGVVVLAAGCPCSTSIEAVSAVRDVTRPVMIVDVDFARAGRASAFLAHVVSFSSDRRMAGVVRGLELDALQQQFVARSAARPSSRRRRRTAARSLATCVSTPQVSHHTTTGISSIVERRRVRPIVPAARDREGARKQRRLDARQRPDGQRRSPSPPSAPWAAATRATSASRLRQTESSCIGRPVLPRRRASRREAPRRFWRPPPTSSGWRSRHAP